MVEFFLHVRGWRLGTWRFSIKTLTWAAEGGDVLSLIGSLHKAIALMNPYAMTSISSAEWNYITNSTTEYQSTPLGCVCANQMQITMMSSSCMEAASNRVPLPLVSTRTHIQLRSSTSSPGMQLWAAKVVPMDVVDIVGERINCAKIDLEESADYYKKYGEITRSLNIRYLG